MPTVTYYNITEIAEELLKYAVITARHNGEWIFCRQSSVIHGKSLAVNVKLVRILLTLES